MVYYLDSNAIIDLIDGNQNILNKIKTVYQSNEDSIKIPDIVYYEVLRGFRYKNAQKKEIVFLNFCQKFGIVQMSLKTLEIAADNYARLLKAGQKLDDDGDIFIGSLAVEHNAVLVTKNSKHLSRIKDIQLENWS